LEASWTPEGRRLGRLSETTELVSILKAPQWCHFFWQLYKTAIGNIFEEEEWGPLQFAIMAKHFERQGKSPYMYHSQYMTHLLSDAQIDAP
jgi:hypothetical protein